MTSNETRLMVAISDLIVYWGLSLNIAQKYRFKKVLDLKINVLKGYQIPNKNILSTDFLGVIHYQNMKKNLNLI